MVKNRLTSAQRLVILSEVLAENGCYDSFIKMLRKKKKYEEIEHSGSIIGHYVFNTTDGSLINNAGSWLSTDEGSNFWSNMENRVFRAMTEGASRTPKCKSIW